MCLMCAHSNTTQKSGHKRFQRRVARLDTTATRFCSSIWILSAKYRYQTKFCTQEIFAESCRSHRWKIPMPYFEMVRTHQAHYGHSPILHVPGVCVHTWRCAHLKSIDTCSSNTVSTFSHDKNSLLIFERREAPGKNKILYATRICKIFWKCNYFHFRGLCLCLENFRGLLSSFCSFCPLLC